MAPVPQPEENDKGPNQNPDHDALDNMEAPDFIINQESSEDESDDGNEGMNGYQMLPQEINQDEGESENSDSGEGNSPVMEVNGSVNERLEEGAEGVTEHVVDRVCPPEGLHTAGGRKPSYMQVPDLPRPKPKELLWNQSPDSSRDISLDSEQTNKIKLTMSKIILPQNNIPDWAKNISDEQWKEKLSQLQKRKHQE